MNQYRGRARIGVLVPFTNTNLEPDLVMMRPEGVSLHFARMGGYDADAIPDESQMQGLGAAELDASLRLLAGAKPDVILYGCTSATLTHGPAFDRQLAARIAQSSGTKTVTAAGSLANALRCLNVSKIGFASPYVPAINDMAVDFLDQMGFQTVERSEVTGALDNDEQGDLEPDAVFELGQAADHPSAEALVLSCTEMRSAEVIAKLEESVGKPVICSNQAMLFQTLQHLGISDPIPGYGQLLEGPRHAI